MRSTIFFSDSLDIENIHNRKYFYTNYVYFVFKLIFLSPSSSSYKCQIYFYFIFEMKIIIVSISFFSFFFFVRSVHVPRSLAKRIRVFVIALLGSWFEWLKCWQSFSVLEERSQFVRYFSCSWHLFFSFSMLHSFVWNHSRSLADTRIDFTNSNFFFLWIWHSMII